MIKIQDLDILNPLRFENCNLEAEITGAHFDSRKCGNGFLYIALKGQQHDGHDFIASAIKNGSVVAIVNADYDNQAGYPVIFTDNVELFFARAAQLWRQKSSAKVVAITGTNGKTSTKEMLHRLLSLKFKTLVTEGNYNNQLGVPLTLFRIQADTEIAVIEMGTNRFGEIVFLSEITAPDYGLITNIGEGHLEELIDKAGVLREKIALFEYLKSHNGLFYINSEDSLLSGYDYSGARVKSFGLTAQADFRLDSHGTDADGKGCFSVADQQVVLGSLGITGCKNAAAALAVGSDLGIDLNEMCQALQNFGAASKRGEILQTATTRLIIDCYNANPSSMQCAVNSTLANGAERTMLVLGDMLEMGSAAKRVHSELGRLLKSSACGRILLFGSEMAACAEVLNQDVRVTYFNTDFPALQNCFDAEFRNFRQVLLKGSRGMRLERLLENLKGETE